MAAQLEKVLRGLIKTPGTNLVNTKYDSQSLTGAVDYTNEFAKANVETKEGQATYRSLTGFKTAGMSDRN